MSLLHQNLDKRIGLWVSGLFYSSDLVWVRVAYCHERVSFLFLVLAVIFLSLISSNKLLLF